MVAGVGIFSVLSGAFAAWFTERYQDRLENDDLIATDATNKQITLLIEEVRALRAKIDKPAS
jgi:hypothetical protein